MSLKEKINEIAKANNLEVSFLKVSNYYPFNSGANARGNQNYYWIQTKGSHYDFVCIGEDGSFICAGVERVREGGLVDIKSVSSRLQNLVKNIGA